MTGYQARAEAAQRLPPLAGGHRDPLDKPACHICGYQTRSSLFWLEHARKWMCRDRVGCYQRARIR